MLEKSHCPHHMPDRPLDPPEAEELPAEQDPDEAYDEQRQREIDRRFEKITADELIELLPCIGTDPYELLDIREEQHHE